MAAEKIELRVELDTASAAALAQFLKRTGYTDWRTKAQNEGECEAMMTAARAVTAALADAGFNPR